jgi:hypothetical protein
MHEATARICHYSGIFQPEISFGACFIPEEGDVKVIELASGDDLFACARELQCASPQ